MIWTKIYLCQPDNNKGCSACCGLFNFKDITREKLSQYLEEGKDRTSEIDNVHFDDRIEYKKSINTRDMTSYICPYQGFVRDRSPGCLIHPENNTEDLRDISFYGRKICSGFLCPAHRILTKNEKQVLIEFIDDWYLYTVAIIDPYSFRWILDFIHGRFGGNIKRTEAFKELLNLALSIHAHFIQSIDGPLFFYSVSEYNIGSKKISLNSDNDAMDQVRQKITNALIESYNSRKGV